MAMSKVTCWICGKQHEYCPVCHQSNGWKYVADTPEHYQIYLVLHEFEESIITKDEATERFAELGITAEANLSWVIPAVEEQIRGIIGKKLKEVKSSKKSK